MFMFSLAQHIQMMSTECTFSVWFAGLLFPISSATLCNDGAGDTFRRIPGKPIPMKHVHDYRRAYSKHIFTLPPLVCSLCRGNAYYLVRMCGRLPGAAHIIYFQPCHETKHAEKVWRVCGWWWCSLDIRRRRRGRDVMRFVRCVYCHRATKSIKYSCYASCARKVLLCRRLMVGSNSHGFTSTRLPLHSERRHYARHCSVLSANTKGYYSFKFARTCCNSFVYTIHKIDVIDRNGPPIYQHNHSRLCRLRSDGTNGDGRCGLIPF